MTVDSVNDVLTGEMHVNTIATPHRISKEIWSAIYNAKSYEELLSLYFKRTSNQRNSDLSSIRDETKFIVGLILHKSPNITLRRIEEVIAQQIWNIDEQGIGPSLNTLLSNIKVVLKSFNPLLSGVVCAHVRDIKTNKSYGTSSYSASYTEVSRTLNFKNTYLPLKTYAHELAHAIHYSLGIKCDANIDNENTDRENWNTNVDINTETELADTLANQWQKFTEGEFDSLRAYQRTNFNEFFAVSFEYLYRKQDDKETLYEEQPAMATIHERIRDRPESVFPSTE